MKQAYLLFRKLDPKDCPDPPIQVHRYEAARSYTTVETLYGPVRVKLKYIDGVLSGVKPEHDDCLRLAAAHQTSLRRVEAAATAAAHALLVDAARS